MFTLNNFKCCIFFFQKKYWWQLFKELINTSSLPSIHLFILQHRILHQGRRENCYADWAILSPYIPREVSDGLIYVLLILSPTAQKIVLICTIYIQACTSTCTLYDFTNKGRFVQCCIFEYFIHVNTERFIYRVFFPFKHIIILN